MDPNAVVLDISSDEETFFDDGGSTDGRYDHNWIADLLEEVNKEDFLFDDSDEVIVVNEVLPVKKTRKKLVEIDDDDCVILDHDPDKSMEVRNNDPVVSNNLIRNNDHDDSDDDLLVVSEKGQVACRDYPHSRHLCIKFPFPSTPSQSHCDQCYCYVCDSLAPCIYWGNGTGNIDHCLATDKDDFWRLKRQNSKTANKNVNIQPMNPVTPAPVPVQMASTVYNSVQTASTVYNSVQTASTVYNPVPPASVPVQTASMMYNPVMRSNPIRASPLSSNFQSPNIVNQNRTPYLLSINKFQPGLVSQQLTRTSSCTIPRDRVNHNYNLATPFNKPVFKRTVSAGAALSTNRNSYSSFRGNYLSQFCPQTNVVNTSVPFSPPNLTFDEAVRRSNSLFDFSSNFQPQVNPDPFVETHVLFQPQVQSSVPSYSTPVEASPQENQSQKSTTVDPKFFNDISWPQSSQNDPAHANGSGAFSDYDYDSWLFNNQPREVESMDVPGSFGLNEFPSDSGFIDTGTLGVRRLFDLCAIALEVILCLVGICHRLVLRRRVRRLAAHQF